MFNRKSILSLALAAALSAPLAALADGFWTSTNDEAGNQVVAPRLGTPYQGVAPGMAKALAFGDISPDRQYVFLGEGNGWQLRPMQNRFEGGRYVHVDDPAGHMHTQADNTPLTAQERLARQNSAGS